MPLLLQEVHLAAGVARAAFNRGQILYRMAEMLEGRKAQFIEELMQQDSNKSKSRERSESCH